MLFIYEFLMLFVCSFGSSAFVDNVNRCDTVVPFARRWVKKKEKETYFIVSFNVFPQGITFTPAQSSAEMFRRILFFASQNS